MSIPEFLYKRLSDEDKASLFFHIDSEIELARLQGFNQGFETVRWIRGDQPNKPEQLPRSWAYAKYHELKLKLVGVPS